MPRTAARGPVHPPSRPGPGVRRRQVEVRLTSAEAPSIRASRDAPLRPEIPLLQPSATPDRPHRVLGLLGGVGSGKSHVARRLAALGPGQVVDADRLAHEALAAAAADGSLEAALGPEAVQDGRPAVAILGARAFEDRDFLSRLEQIAHPPVHAAILAALEAFHAQDAVHLLVLDVPLLIEVGLDRRCDALWFVDTPDALRAERGAARGLTLEEIRRRESFQTPLARKRARADRVIHNDVTPAALDDQIRTGLEALGLTPGDDTPGTRPPNDQPQENGTPTGGPAS